MEKKRGADAAHSGASAYSVKGVLVLLPVLLAVGFVPLIVTAKSYSIGLGRFPWFFNTSDSVDLFLYWKGQALLLLAFLMLVGFLFFLSVKEQRHMLWQKSRTLPLACLGLYLILAVLSTIFSVWPDQAFWGSYEQWEGLPVLLAYGILLLYTYCVVDSEAAVKLFVYGLIAGSFVLGLIGAGQFMQMDFFRSEAGQNVMKLFMDSDMKFSFNFSDGWVYSTLYNPNYVGSYAALALPVVVAAAMQQKKKIPPFWVGLAMVDACLLLITLIGSQSVTGCVGVVAGAVFFLAFMLPGFVKTMGRRKIAVGAAGIAVFITLLCVFFPEGIQYGVNKIFHPTRDYHVVASMLSTDRGLEVTTVSDETFYVQLTGNQSSPMTVAGEDGREIPLANNKTDDGSSYYVLKDDRFKDFRLYPKTVTAGKTGYPAVQVSNPDINKMWTIVQFRGQYMVYNAFGKLDELREIPAWGFEKNQHFGDKRGYIWSRTIPLLKDYIFLGCGPNVFTMIFPNDDYVGKTNMNYDGVIVTKPHNMYLQIWAHTGLLSLLAFLVMVIWYLAGSMKLYFNRPLNGLSDRLGLAVMISIFSYLVTGLANDSTVAVAPVFWGLLGLGMAINRKVKKEQSGEAEGNGCK